MSGRVCLIENESWHRLDAARQDHIANGPKLVAGARVLRAAKLMERVTAAEHPSSQFQDVYVFPVLVPEEEGRALALAKELQKAMPFPRLFGLCVLLIGSEKSSPESWMDAFWVDYLDGLYDIAIPTQVVAWHGGLAQVESFQLAASLSSLFRELDSLQELAKLNTLFAELESRVSGLENGESYGED